MKLTILPNTTFIQWRRLLCTLSVIYFLAACASPALYFQKVLDVTVRNVSDGWMVLLGGWMGIVFWWTLAWLANPCYIIALICFLRWARDATIIWGSFALLFALLTLELFSRSSLDNLGGNERLVGLGSGFYFWLASIVILLFAAWMDSDEGDAFFQQRFPWIQIAGKTLSSAFLLTFVLSLPALTIGGTNFFTAVIKINSRNREYQEYLRNHPPDDRATREAKEREKSVSLVGGSDRAVDWHQDGSGVQGDYITHSYNPRQFLPVDRSERPPVSLNSGD